MARFFAFSIFSMIVVMSWAPQASACECPGFCDAMGAGLAGPMGGVAVASIFGGLNFVGNLIGGLRWNKHFGVDDETSARVQEAGWMICAGASLILGLGIPIWIYCYNKNHPAAARMAQEI